MIKDKDDCVCYVSKSGKNLNAKIPTKYLSAIGRGDKVKITVIEKATIDEEKLLSTIQRAVNKPNGEKFKGNILGYPVEIPLSKILKYIPKTKVKKLLCEAIAK